METLRKERERKKQRKKRSKKKRLSTFLNRKHQRGAQTQFPTNKNYAIEFSAFGEIAGINTPRSNE